MADMKIVIGKQSMSLQPAQVPYLIYHYHGNLPLLLIHRWTPQSSNSPNVTLERNGHKSTDYSSKSKEEPAFRSGKCCIS